MIYSHVTSRESLAPFWAEIVYLPFMFYSTVSNSKSTLTHTHTHYEPLIERLISAKNETDAATENCIVQNAMSDGASALSIGMRRSTYVNV